MLSPPCYAYLLKIRGVIVIILVKRYLAFISLLLYLAFVWGCMSKVNQTTNHQGAKNNTEVQDASVVSIIAGDHTSFALTSKGELFAWGLNEEGYLGIGNSQDTKVPVKVVLEKKVKQIVPGAFSLALTEDGEVYTWGVTSFGVYEGDSKTFTATPVRFALPERIAKIGNGNGVGLAISESGSLYTWGWNYYGQRGDGTQCVDGTGTNSFVPYRVDLPKRVVDASCIHSHVMALCEDGSVYTWGSNFFGEIGDGAPVAYQPGGELVENTVLKPYKVDFHKKIIAVATGRGVSFALDEDGVLYSWGANDVGQLGIADSKVVTSSTPRRVAISKKVKMIASGDFHALALCEDGTLYSWGYNNRDGKSSLTGTGSTERVIFEPRKVAIPGEIIAISAGNGHTWVMTKNGIYGWGNNSYGQIDSDLPSPINTPTRITLNIN